MGGQRAGGSPRRATSSHWFSKIAYQATPGPLNWHCVGREGVEDADGFSGLHFFSLLVLSCGVLPAHESDRASLS